MQEQIRRCEDEVKRSKAEHMNERDQFEKRLSNLEGERAELSAKE